ncbi:achaete-scute complex protein T3 [Galendromus occidentalis]|uniref:Achaete-scute complex protein T3 n=1 Tax=Galendromus occidentalis TaxID=34638 RepID=A0AAJ6VW97_9ACAR|nr:achaete-scute complex protein T3 [Galendromus occidentalis]
MNMQQSLVMSPTSEEDFSWAQTESMSGFCPSPSSDDSQSSLLENGGSDKDDKKKSSTYKHVPHREKPPHLVARRNARERRRVQAVNGVFAKLRKCVPIENRSKRLSKVKTLHKAIEYIAALQRLLAESDPVTKDRQNNNNSNSSIATTIISHNNDDNNNSNSAAPNSPNAAFTQIGEVSSTSSFKQELVPQSGSVPWSSPTDQFPAGQDYPYMTSFPTYSDGHTYQQESHYHCAPVYVYPPVSARISPC